MNNKIKKLAPIVALLILILGVVVGVSLIQRNQQLKSQASQLAAPVVFFSPKTQEGLVKDGEFYVDLVVNTSGNLVSGVDVDVRYPGNLLRLIEFRADPASGLETIVIPGIPDNYSNILRFTAVNKTGTLPVRNAIKIGDLKFRAVKDGKALVNVSNAQLVIANQDEAVKPGSETGVYTIGAGTPPPPPPPPPAACIDGDADGNGCVDGADLTIWRLEFSKSINSQLSDFSPVCQGTKRGDGVIDISDAAVWLREFTLGANRCKP